MNRKLLENFPVLTFLFVLGNFPVSARNPNRTRNPNGSRKPSVTRKTIFARNGESGLGKIMKLNRLFRDPLRGGPTQGPR